MTNNIQSPIRLSAGFSTETLQVFFFTRISTRNSTRREWYDICKVMKRKKVQPKIIYTARLSFRFDREIKSFPVKQKLREFSTTNQLYNKC